MGSVISNLEKRNPDMMKKLHASLEKKGLSIRNIEESKVTKSSVKESLRSKKDDVLKIWCTSNDGIIACTVGNFLVDENFNWHKNVKRGVVRDDSKIIGSKGDVRYWIEEGDSYIKEVGDHVYHIRIDDMENTGTGSLKMTRRERHEQIEKAKVEAKNAKESLERNMAEAEAMKQCLIQERYWNKIIDKIVAQADTYEEAKNIVRGELPALTAAIRKYSESGYNESGIPWIYQKYQGLIDYSKPIGIPSFPQNYVSCMNYIGDTCEPLFEQWVKNGKRKGDIDRSILIPVAIVTDDNEAFYPDNRNFVPVAVNSVLFNTAGGLNPKMTRQSKVVRYSLVEDCKKYHIYSFRKL